MVKALIVSAVYRAETEIHNRPDATVRRNYWIAWIREYTVPEKNYEAILGCPVRIGYLRNPITEVNPTTIVWHIAKQALQVCLSDATAERFIQFRIEGFVGEFIHKGLSFIWLKPSPEARVFIGALGWRTFAGGWCYFYSRAFKWCYLEMEEQIG